MSSNISRSRAARRTLVAALAATFLVASCGSDQQSVDATGSPAAASIDVSSVWARTSPMVAEAGALYLTIDNNGGLDDALIAAHVDPSIAKTAELHETVAVETSMAPAAGGRAGPRRRQPPRR